MWGWAERRRVNFYAGRSRRGRPFPAEIDDAELERRLYLGSQGRPRQRPEPDWQHVNAELCRHKGTTLERLWMKYRADHSDGYQYYVDHGVMESRKGIQLLTN